MLKKFVLLLLSVVMVLSLVACATEKETKQEANATLEQSQSTTDKENTSTNGEDSTQNSAGTEAIPDDAFVFCGNVLEIGMTVTKELIANIGDTIDVQTAPSCHYDGEDTIYVYENFSLYTYLDGEKEVLYLIEITSDGVATPKGIKIGSTYEEMKNSYGTPIDETAVFSSYETSTALLTFYITDGIVESIEYSEKLN